MCASATSPKSGGWWRHHPQHDGKGEPRRYDVTEHAEWWVPIRPWTHNKAAWRLPFWAHLHETHWFRRSQRDASLYCWWGQRWSRTVQWKPTEGRLRLKWVPVAQRRSQSSCVRKLRWNTKHVPLLSAPQKWAGTGLSLVSYIQASFSHINQ